MPDWLTPVIGIIGLIVGVAITESRQWIERRDKYRAMVFEKRLSTHQEAFSLCYTMHSSVNKCLITSRNKTQLGKALEAIENTKDWWVNNCLYLDSKSQGLILNTVFLYSKRLRDIVENKEDKASESYCRERLVETLDSIAKGVGVKYLPEIKEQLKSLK